jgi:hypothetical protein
MSHVIEIPAVDRRCLLREYENNIYAIQCGACGACSKIYHSGQPHYVGCPTLAEGIVYSRRVSAKLAVFDAQPLQAPAPLPLATLMAACRTATPLGPRQRIRVFEVAIPVGPITRKRGRVVGMTMSVGGTFSGVFDGTVISTATERTVLRVRADDAEAYLAQQQVYRRRAARRAQEADVSACG